MAGSPASVLIRWSDAPKPTQVFFRLLFPYPLTEWAIFLGLAFGPGLLCHTLLNWSLIHVDASIGSPAFLGTPVLSTLLAVVLLSEIASTVTFIAGGIVLGGVYLVSTGVPDS